MYYKITIETISELDEGEKYPKTEKIYEQVLPELEVAKIVAVVNKLQAPL